MTDTPDTAKAAIEYGNRRLSSWSRNDPDRIPKELRCIRALLSRIATLEEALRPFAEVAETGKSGGKFVIAHAFYDDMKHGDSAPRQSYWHWSHFEAARSALGEK